MTDFSMEKTITQLSRAEQLALRAMAVDLHGARARVAELQQSIATMEEYEIEMRLEISEQRGLRPDGWTWSADKPEVITVLPLPEEPAD